MPLRETSFQVAVSGVHFAEGPRWQDGYLWFSDMMGHRVMRYRPGGAVDTVVPVPDDRPSGLGWLPDGRLLVVAMETRALLRREPSGELILHADLSGLCWGFANDMIVAADGTAYVGDSGLANFGTPGERRPGKLIRVRPDGSTDVVATDLVVPNGCILTDDDRTLIVAEAHAGHITAYDVDADGGLDGRRRFAHLGPAPGQDRAHPDGICLDAEGAVWVADIRGRRLLRVRSGGEIADSVILTGFMPVACVLGGPDRRTLFVCATRHRDEGSPIGASPENVVLAAEVDVPGAGRP